MTLEEQITQHPYRSGLKALAVIVVVVVVLVALSLALGWFKGTTSIVSFSHVKQEYAFGYDYDRAMQASARNVCIGKKNGLDPSAIAAYEQTYSNTEGIYDARMADAFRAKHVKPSDLPLIAPSLGERERLVCP